MSFDLTADGARGRELDRLMREHGTAVYRMCCLYLRNSETAKDAAQDTFLKAYRAMARFRGECAEQTWLMRIAINTCKDYARLSWLRRADGYAGLDVPEKAVEPSADDTVLRAVTALPQRYRQVVLLRYYQDMPLSEIAAALGVPVATGSTRLRRARKRLHDELKGWYFDEE